MRRPLTVRWWFRVLLVAILCIAGYSVAYYKLRSVTPYPETVGIEYDGAQRIYVTSRGQVMSNFLESKGSLKTHASPWEFADDWSWRFRTTPAEGQGGWLAVFYLAERIELLLRGYAVYGEDTEQLESDFAALVEALNSPSHPSFHVPPDVLLPALRDAEPPTTP